MLNEHVISDEAFNHILTELGINNHWLAYNAHSYFLEIGDVELFRTKEQAIDYADNNFSDYDNFTVVQVNLIADVTRKIPYGKHLEKLTNHSNAHVIYNNRNGLTD